MNREEQIVEALNILREAKHSITPTAVRDLILNIGELRNNTATQDLPESWYGAFQRTIRALVAAGVLIRNGDILTWPKEPPQAQPEPSNIPPKRRDGGDGGPPSDGGEGGNGGNSGGGGFRAVLAHPYLFALPRDEFEQLLEAI